MKTEIQILVYNEEQEILSSSHFDKMPNSIFINSLIQKDNGSRAEVYEIDYPSELSKLICEFY